MASYQSPVASSRARMARARTAVAPQQTGGGTPATAGSAPPTNPYAAATASRVAGAPTQKARSLPSASTGPVAGNFGPMYNAQTGGATPATAAPPSARATMTQAAPAPQYEQWRNTPQGVATARSPYGGDMPRYQGIDDQDIAWANEALTARRPDGSFVYKDSERNHAQKQIIDRMRNQDRELADPLSATSLRQQWGREMQGDVTRQADAEGGYRRAAAGTDAAIDGVNGYRPSESEEFDLSFLRDYDPTQLNAWNPEGLDGFDSQSLRGVDLNPMKNWQAKALPGVNTSKLGNFDGGAAISDYLEQSGGPTTYNTDVQAGSAGNFDPMAFMREAATGASAISSRMLKDQLEEETNAAARMGRLKTGLLDADKGRVITRVGEDLNDTISSRAMEAARIKADLLAGDASLTTQANIASGRERGNLATSNAALRSAEARDAGQLSYNALRDSTGYNVDIASALDDLSLDATDRATGYALDQASDIDRNSLTAAEATDRMRLDRAGQVDDTRLRAQTSYGQQEGNRRQFVDESRYGALSDGADLSLRRQTLAQDREGSMIDRTGDRIASERDRITAQQNFDAALKAAKKQGDWDLVGQLTRIGVAAFGGG